MITAEEARHLWVQALRSGKYEQTTLKLRGEGNERCCLGVACDVYKDLTGKGEWMAEGQDAHFNPGGGKRTDGMSLPPAVSDFFGLTSENVDVLDTDLFHGTTLAELNDEGKSFEYIADLIEKGRVEVRSKRTRRS